MKISKSISAALVAIALLASPAHALLKGSPSSGNLPNTPLTNFNLGGGGNISGQSLISGARLVRGDVFGAYIFGTDNKWHLINGQSNMCPGGYPSVTNCHFGYFPGTNTSANQVFVGFSGIIELVGCPNLISCAYMYGGNQGSNAYVFYSDNVDPAAPTAIRWCVTNVPVTTGTSNSAIGASPSNPGPMMAVDPNNPDHVLVGTATTGIFESFNATLACSAPGTDTWTAISTASIPQGTAYPGYLVAFDLTAPTMTCHTGSGTCTSTYYVSTNGAPSGIYATFDAGTTWTAISSAGSPPNTPLHHIKVSAASAGGGNLWVTTGAQLWEYNNASGTPCSTGLGTCTFHQLTPTSVGNDVAINPLNGNQIISMGSGGKASVSTNGAAAVPTFTGTLTGTPAAGDTPWTLATVAGTSLFGINNVDFDPLNNGTLLGHGSQWEYTTTFPSTNYTWTALSSGIQGAVSFGNLAVSAANTLTVAYEDIIGCTFSISTAGTPPSVCALPSQGSNGLYEFAGLSVAPGTTTMFSAGQEDTGVFFNLSGYSTDGFRTNFLPYNQWNASVVASSANVTSGAASAIRLNVGSTSLLNSFAPGDALTQHSIVCIVSQFFTSLLSQNCWPINVIDGSHIDLVGSTFNSGVQVNAAQSYTVYVPANVLSEYFGGGAVVNVTSGAGSLVQVTFPGTAFGGVPNNAPVCISGVAMTGATVVNGCWVANSVSNVVTLRGSAFVPGDTYSTGGTVLYTLIEQSVAASTTTNIAIYGGDSTPAYCTTDAGATWSEITPPGIPVALTTVTGGPYSAGTTSITLTSGSSLANGMTLLLVSGRLLKETGSTIVGNTVTSLKAPIPPGDSLATGSPVYGQQALGGPFAAFFRSHQIDADQVTPNTFYYMNANVGLVKWTNCGSPTVVATHGTPSFLADAGDGDQLKAVPGQAGHLFYTAGPVGGAGANHPATNTLWRTCNGVNSTSNSVTVSQVPGFFEPLAVGFGRPAPGHSYATIYVAGWYSPTNTQNTATFGIWLSRDDSNNGATGTCATGNTWTEISGTGGFSGGFPSATVLDISGDPFNFGPYYVFTGLGAFYGVQNFLLNRDLDPASNDNTPAFMDNAA